MQECKKYVYFEKKIRKKMTDYFKWLYGNGCCKPKPCNCNNEDVCSCDNILLQISNLNTDLLGKQDKLSAGTGISIDDNIISVTGGGSGVTIDAYTKEESDERFQPIGNYALESDIPSLSGYATEEWVLDKHYITGIDLSDYALKTDIPTDVSAFINDAGYLTEHQSLSAYSTTVQMNEAINAATSGKADASAVYTKTEVDAIISGLTAQITSLQSRLNECCPPTVEGKALITDVYGDTYTIDCNSSTTLTINERLANTGNLSVTALTSVAFGDCVTTINDSLFQNTRTFNGEGISSLTFSDTIEMIGSNAFEGNPFTSVTLPSGLTGMGIYAFYRCENLESINIPTSLTYINMGAFAGCKSLTSITLHSGIEAIGDGAFMDCTGLTGVTILATTPPQLDGNNAFSFNSGIPTYPIYVPSESVNAYKQANGWSDYADRIQAIA